MVTIRSQNRPLEAWTGVIRGINSMPGGMRRAQWEKKRFNLWEWASQCGAMLSIKNESLVVGVVRINVG